MSARHLLGEDFSGFHAVGGPDDPLGLHFLDDAGRPVVSDLEGFDARPFTLQFLEIHNPVPAGVENRVDGIEFLRRAKLLTSAKVIIISSVARIDSREAQEVLELGAADIIPKPSGVLSIDFEEQKSLELLDAIHKCL